MLSQSHDFECPTSVFVGNLRSSTRVSELKAALHILFRKILKLQVSENDISLFTGSRRYAIINVHNMQNVDFVLENLHESTDLTTDQNFDFDDVVECGMSLHVDTVKSYDEKQAMDDVENTGNHKPYQKPHTSRTAMELRLVSSSTGQISVVEITNTPKKILKTPTPNMAVKMETSIGVISQISHGSMNTHRSSYGSLNTTRSSSDSITTRHCLASTAARSRTSRNTPKTAVNFRHSYQSRSAGRVPRSSYSGNRRPRVDRPIPGHSTDLDTTAEETENFADDEGTGAGDMLDQMAVDISDVVAKGDSDDSGAEMENPRPDSETPVPHNYSPDSFIDLRRPKIRHTSDAPRRTKHKAETSVHWSESQSSFTESRPHIKHQPESPVSTNHGAENELIGSKLNRSMPSHKSHILKLPSPGPVSLVEDAEPDTAPKGEGLVDRNDFFAFLDNHESKHDPSEPHLDERDLQHDTPEPRLDERDLQHGTPEPRLDERDLQHGTPEPCLDERDLQHDTPEPSTNTQKPTSTEEANYSTSYYKAGEVIANDDGSKSFRAYIGQYTLREMREQVTRSVCGFLNTGHRGTLLIGVRTDGLVLGIECDAEQEERMRRHFEAAIREIFPRIYIEDYSIHFVPLVDMHGRHHGGDLKVVEVFVDSVPNLDCLYECKDGVFVWRRGALLGPILPSHIQEWSRKKHSHVLGEIRQSEISLQEELTRQEMMIRRQADTIAAQKSEIESARREQLVQKPPPKSRTCCIL